MHKKLISMLLFIFLISLICSSTTAQIINRETENVFIDKQGHWAIFITVDEPDFQQKLE